MENVNILSLVAVLSNYDAFHIETDSGYEFGAVNIVPEKYGGLIFERLFSTPKYTDGEVREIFAVSETEFVCKTDCTQYTIQALHKKLDRLMVTQCKSWLDISDFMEIDYLSLHRYLPVENALFYIVNPYNLGELTTTEKFQIKNFIDAYLEGYYESQQVCRTVYFKVVLKDDRQRIYSGVYNLETMRPTTEVLVYDTTYCNTFLDDKTDEKSRLLIEYANQEYMRISLNNT